MNTMATFTMNESAGGELRREALRGFPTASVAAVERWFECPTRENLDLAVRGLLEFYLPRGSRRSLGEVPGSARLREDLGIDSLSLAEALFKWDEVFGVPIETHEAAEVRTLDELVVFLADKMEGVGGSDFYHPAQ
ncbi:MAG: acyl carrier protein [Verrucomicrobiales bacterium]